jgi:hypothetical protein
VWQNLDVNAAKCFDFMRNSEYFRASRTHLSRIVPALNDTGPGRRVAQVDEAIALGAHD